MNVREELIKHLTTILRGSEGTILVVLCDLNGLTIAQIGRKSDIELNANQITSLASAAFSASEENWEDLDIKDQIISFSFYETVCLITIKVNETLLTIVHDYHKEWPLDVDNIASSMYFLKQKLGEFFGTAPDNANVIEDFSNKVRSAIYLFGMGSEIPFVSYTPSEYDKSNSLSAISRILDSIQNQIFIMYSLVGPSGLTYDARDISGQNLPLSIEAFSANANMAFQKMKEESEESSLGELLCYTTISGQDVENFHGLIACPSGFLRFSDIKDSSNSEDVTFLGLFPLAYGVIPVIGESRNIIHSIAEVIGKEEITEKLISTINTLTNRKYE